MVGQTDYTCGDGVAAMVEELPESRAAIGPSGLLAVNGIQWLVDEKA